MTSTSSGARRPKQPQKNHTIINPYAETPAEASSTGLWAVAGTNSVIHSTVDEFKAKAAGAWTKAVIVKLTGMPSPLAESLSEKWNDACINTVLFDADLRMAAECVICKISTASFPKRNLLRVIDAVKPSTVSIVDGCAPDSLDAVTGFPMPKSTDGFTLKYSNDRSAPMTISNTFRPFVDRMCVLYNLSAVLDAYIINSIRSLNENTDPGLALSTSSVEDLIKILTEDDPGMAAFGAYIAETLEILYNVAS